MSALITFAVGVTMLLTTIWVGLWARSLFHPSTWQYDAVTMSMCVMVIVSSLVAIVGAIVASDQ